jgi:biopolymer transport protein ExbD
MSRGPLFKFLAALVSSVLAGCSEEPTQAIAPSVNPDNIVITVDRKGNMYLNGKLVGDEGDLLAQLVARSKPASKDAASSNIVMLEIFGDGTYVWNGQRVPDAQALEGYWKSIAAQSPQPEVRLKPDRNATFDLVGRALEGAQRNGVTNLAFAGNASQQ